jgi:ParB-like chromosome segregation protein Spo0J
MPLELRTLPIDQLKPAAYNPRKLLRPGSPAYRKLKASIAEFGLVEPLVWNELTGHVVGGHARLGVLRELGFTELPVSVVRLDEKREKALNIVLNNQEAQGRYDPTKLANLLEELEGLPELELTGFDAGTLRTLKMEPVEEQEPAMEDGRVEITIVTNETAFGTFRERLDELVAEFDLVTHIRRT